MPWVTTGYGSQTSYHWTAGTTYNMGGSPITIPSSCAVTKLRVYTAGRGGSASMRLMLWDGEGKLLRYSDLFTASQGSDSIGGQYWYERDISPVKVSKGTYHIGIWRNPSYSHYYPSSSGGHLYRNNNVSSPGDLSLTNDYGITLMARLFYITAPAAPTNVKVSRSSDTRHTVSWTRQSSEDRPYESITIQRWDNVSGAYQTVHTATGSATSWTDNGTVANRKYRYRIYASNAAGNSSYAYSDFFYTTPAAPSNATVSRQSDTQHNLAWNNGSYAADVCQTLKIQRWDNVSDAYVDVKSFSAPPPSSYSDITTKADRRYRYRIRAQNTGAGGATLYSSWVLTDYIYTTPKVPSDAQAIRDGQDVVVTCVNDSTIVEVTRLEYRVDGGGWQPLTTFDGAANSYRHTEVPGGVLRYRWRNERDSLYSGWAESNDILTETPPAAPTNLSPSGIVLDVREDRVFSWRHNPLDGSFQRMVQLRIREKGSSWVEYPSFVYAEGGITYNLDADFGLVNGTEYEWQVRTWGSHPDPGPWSATAAFKTSARPVVVITYPAADYDIHDYPELTVSWDYTDPKGKPQVGYVITLYSSDGKVLVTHTGTGEIFEKTLNYAVKDGGSYRIGVRAQDADGMWSTETIRIFSVVYLPPAEPLLNWTLDRETGTVLVSIINPYDPDAPEVAYNRVYRQVDGQVETLIADRVPPDGSVTDFIPGVNNENVYWVEAVSEIGSVAESDRAHVDFNIPEYIWINGGPSFSEFCKLSFQMSLSHGFGRISTQRRFAGRKYPVHFEGEELNWETTISAAIDYDQIEDIENFIQNNPGPYFYRDPAGRRFLVAMVDPGIDERPPGLPVFSCRLIRLEGTPSENG